MSLLISFRFALESLRLNPIRAILSLLGITIGIFAIISVFTVLDSMQDAIKNNISKLGDNTLFVHKWPWAFNDPNYAWWKYMNRPNPTQNDYNEIKKRSQKALAITFGAHVNRNVQYKEASAENIEIQSYTYEAEQVRNLDIAEGRYFSVQESERGKNCAIIGSKLANDLLDGDNPINKTIKVFGQKVKIIGVFKKEGNNMFGGGMDNTVLLPINFSRDFINLNSENIYTGIGVKAAKDVSLDELNDELRGIMRSVRRLRPTQEDNFALNKISLVSQSFNQMFMTIDIAGLIIGGFAILVGAFGIANIMFVSVKEQTKIIGITKALGAKNRIILMQFLFEAVILSMLGGVLGLILIYICTVYADVYIQDMTFLLTTKNISMGLIISIVVGIVSGFTPARSAAKLDPVVAMSRN